MKESLQDYIQKALQEQRKIVWGDSFYEPSPGQIMSHVDYRVAKIAARAAEEWFRRSRGGEDWVPMHPGYGRDRNL